MNMQDAIVLSQRAAIRDAVDKHTSYKTFDEGVHSMQTDIKIDACRAW